MKDLLSLYKKYVNYPNHKKCTENLRYFYFIKYTDLCLFKFGVTNNIRQRLNQIRTASGLNIQELLLLKCQVDYDESPYVVEQFLINFFKDKKTQGEWFKLSTRDIIQVRQLIWFIEGECIVDNIR